MRRHALAGGGLLVAFGVLCALVTAGWSPLLRLDHRVLTGLNDAIAPHDGQQDVWTVVTDVLQPVTWRVLAVAAAALAWVRGRRDDAVRVVVAVAIAAALSPLLKSTTDRARPDPVHVIITAAGRSFPSGHALAAASVATALVLLVPRGPVRAPVTAVAALLVAAVGVSRLVLGVHYLSDVVAGVVLGCGISLVVWSAGRVTYPSIR